MKLETLNEFFFQMSFTGSRGSFLGDSHFYGKQVNYFNIPIQTDFLKYCLSLQLKCSLTYVRAYVHNRMYWNHFTEKRVASVYHKNLVSEYRL